MAHEELEPKLRIGNLLVGKVVEVADNDESKMLTAENKIPIEKQIKIAKERCASEGHQLSVREVNGTLQVICGCGVQASKFGVDDYKNILVYLKQLQDRLDKLERTSSSTVVKNNNDSPAMVIAQALCAANELQIDMRGVIADLTAKLNRSSLSAADGAKLSRKLVEAFQCLHEIEKQ